jgi:hypothetical protein
MSDSIRRRHGRVHPPAVMAGLVIASRIHPTCGI